MQARWHVDHVGTQARMARDLANSIKNTLLSCYYSLHGFILHSNFYARHLLLTPPSNKHPGHLSEDRGFTLMLLINMSGAYSK